VLQTTSAGACQVRRVAMTRAGRAAFVLPHVVVSGIWDSPCNTSYVCVCVCVCVNVLLSSVVLSMQAPTVFFNKI